MLVVSKSSQETGNAITGIYTVTLTTENTEIDQETLTFSEGTAQFSTFAFDLVTQTQTGNHVTGNYTLANTDDLHSSSLNETGSNDTGNFSLTETTNGTSIGSETGNEITGIYTTTDMPTDSYQATETFSAAATSFSLVETGSDTVTASAVGNNVTGNLNQYDTVTDNYTMTETGTQAAGAFSEVVTGSDTYRDQETGTPQQGNYSVYETGSGTFDRTDSGPGAGLPSGPGLTYDYTLSQTYSSLRGGTSQTTVSGGDRYSLLEQWQDLSASGLGTGQAGVGTTVHQAYGVPVATVSWWNTPLSTRDGDPYGNSGDALKDPVDTDYSGGAGGDFGEQPTPTWGEMWDEALGAWGEFGGLVSEKVLDFQNGLQQIASGEAGQRFVNGLESLTGAQFSAETRNSLAGKATRTWQVVAFGGGMGIGVKNAVVGLPGFLAGVGHEVPLMFGDVGRWYNGESEFYSKYANSADVRANVHTLGFKPLFEQASGCDRDFGGHRPCGATRRGGRRVIFCGGFGPGHRQSRE